MKLADSLLPLPWQPTSCTQKYGHQNSTSWFTFWYSKWYLTPLHLLSRHGSPALGSPNSTAPLPPSTVVLRSRLLPAVCSPRPGQERLGQPGDRSILIGWQLNVPSPRPVSPAAGNLHLPAFLPPWPYLLPPFLHFIFLQSGFYIMTRLQISP